MSDGLKDAYASWDGVTREIHDKDNVLVGQMVVNRECLKVWAWYDRDFTAGAVKNAVIACQVDIPKPCRSLGR